MRQHKSPGRFVWVFWQQQHCITGNLLHLDFAACKTLLLGIRGCRLGRLTLAGSLRIYEDLSCGLLMGFGWLKCFLMDAQEFPGVDKSTWRHSIEEDREEGLRSEEDTEGCLVSFYLQAVTFNKFHP